jgi:hypothetical protein
MAVLRPLRGTAFLLPATLRASPTVGLRARSMDADTAARRRWLLELVDRIPLAGIGVDLGEPDVTIPGRLQSLADWRQIPLGRGKPITPWLDETHARKRAFRCTGVRHPRRLRRSKIALTHGA